MDCPSCKTALRHGSPICSTCGIRVPTLGGSQNTSHSVQPLVSVQTPDLPGVCVNCDTALRPGNPICTVCGRDGRIRRTQLTQEPQSLFNSTPQASAASPGNAWQLYVILGGVMLLLSLALMLTAEGVWFTNYWQRNIGVFGMVIGGILLLVGLVSK